jgi:O-antigen/teichoic acid export membrane protein
LARTSRLSGRAFWGFASWALPLVIVFIVSPRLLHLLGADRFGVLMIALVTPLIAGQFDFGISATGVRRIAAEAANGRIEAGTTLFTLFAALTALGGAAGIALWLAAPALAGWIGFSEVLGPEEATRLLRTCAVWYCVSLALTPPGVVARALQSFQLIAAIQTAGTLLLWLAALALLRAGRTIEDVVLLGIALAVVSSLVTLMAVRPRIRWRGALRFQHALMRSDWRFSLGMFAAQAAGAIVYQADRILVSTLGSPAMAGLYAICTSVANKSSAAVSSLTSFVFPHAAQLASSNQREAFAGLLHALNRAIAVLVIPALLPAVWLSGPFLKLWIGAFASPEVIGAFRVLVVAFALPAFGVPVSSVLAGTGNSGLPARFAWLTVAVIIAALVLLVPAFGLVGAAIAMLVANSTSLLFAVVGRRTLGVPGAEGSLRFWSGVAIGVAAQLAVLAMFGGEVASWTALLAVGALAWTAFYASRAIVGALCREERDLIDRVRGRFPGALPR